VIIFVNAISYEPLVRICNYDTVGDEDELCRFGGKRSKVKGHGHHETIYMYDQSMLEGIFSPVSGMHLPLLINPSQLLITRYTLQ